MDYFYTPPNKISPETLLIDGDEFSHLVHVMRKKEGDEIRVVDGLGKAYDVRLSGIRKKEAHGEIFGSYEHHNEPSVNVTLAVGILKNPSKFDFLVEKVTELGVREIIPLQTERTIPSHAKVDRWQKLALAAMKQCGRSYLPHVSELMTFDEVLTRAGTFERKLIAHEKATDVKNLDAILRAPGSVLITVGPEGGFTEEEVTGAVAQGFSPLYFGNRRLRTETAAVLSVACAVALQELRSRLQAESEL